MSQIDFQNPYKSSELAAGKAALGWIPSTNILDHHGNVIHPAWDFFAPPPENIGEITNASSTLTKDEQPWSVATRGMVAGGIFAACVVVLAVIGIAAQWEPGVYLMIGLGVGAVGALIAWFCTTFEHAVMFVGTEGCARIWCGGDRDSLTTVEIFRFDRAAELRTAETRHYKNGVYQHTSFSFTWTDEAGNVAHDISGSHGYEFDMPPSETDYAYANRAEIAWSQFLLNRLLDPIDKGGFSQFNLSGGDWVRVGKGFCEFCIGGTTERVRTEDMLSAEIANGWLKIKRRDAVEGWFSNSGVFEFAYSDVANARLFMIMFENYAAPNTGA